MWLWSLVWLILWTGQRTSGYPSDTRFSDLQLSHGGSSPEFFDPSGLHLPMERTETVELDTIPGAPLSPSDFEASDTLTKESIDPNFRVDPLEIAGLFQGDIMLNAGEQPEDILALNESKQSRSAITDMHRRWPNGIIPYIISASYNETERSIIATAMKQLHEKSCLRFIPRTSEMDYIHILKGDGCSSSVGRVGGPQPISLGSSCIFVGIVIHSFMHAAGFWHEHSRSDRDHYILINEHNIKPEMWYNFAKYGWDIMQDLGVPYDLESVMHFGPYAFTKNEREPTIIPRIVGVNMGQRRGLSKRDALKLQRLYKCQSTSDYATSTSTGMPLLEASTERCVDNNEKYCTVWAEKGECENNPTWMNVNCRKACKQCEKCLDNDEEYCPVWADEGECDNNPTWMNDNCRKACKQCE